MGGLNIFEWLGIVDLDNESLAAKGALETIECERAYDDLFAELAPYVENGGNADAIAKQFTDAYAYLVTSNSDLQMLTPANSDDATPELIKAWEKFFLMTDNFQAICDDKRTEISRGVLVQDLEPRLPKSRIPLLRFSLPRLGLSRSASLPGLPLFLSPLLIPSER